MGYDETDMTEDEFDARWSTGRPTDLAKRPRDLNRLAASIVEDATDEDPPPEPLPVPSDQPNVTFVASRLDTDAFRTAPQSRVPEPSGVSFTP